MKSILKILFITSLFTCLQQTAFAQDADKTVSITASGSGKTQDDAKQSALRSTIEQAFGAFISSKTEILNDQVVADQIASVANGNIQSFAILNESQLPDGSWAVTLKAIVSVSKLTSFVEAKGIAVEIKGGLFALNIKQQILNEQGEIKALNEMVGLLLKIMRVSFDYEIKAGDPKSLDSRSEYWEIPLSVTAKANKNMDFCANYCIKTLAGLSLSSKEVESYISLKKGVVPVLINYNGVAKKFFLRKSPYNLLYEKLFANWRFYMSLFVVQSGLTEFNPPYYGLYHDFVNMDGDDRTKFIKIDFLTSRQTAGSFSWQDKRTLAQIEQMAGYTVKPIGEDLQLKHGGFVVYEKKNGHGLVAAIADLGLEGRVIGKKFNGGDRSISPDDLVINGYSDWRRPTKDELNELYINLAKRGIGRFSKGIYYSGSYKKLYGPFGGEDQWRQSFINGKMKTWKSPNLEGKGEYIRVVRSF